MAQVLAVISGKGGTGKTSLCAGVASCLAMEGQRVLCVDLDVGLRNLDIALGMSDMAVLPFTSVMRGEYSLQQVSQHPTIENLALLTAPVTEDSETIDTETFGKLLAEARGSYDWILLDAPAGVGSLFRMAIRFPRFCRNSCIRDDGDARHHHTDGTAAGLPNARYQPRLPQPRHSIDDIQWQGRPSRLRLPACDANPVRK